MPSIAFVLTWYTPPGISMRYVLLTEQGCERRTDDASVRFEIGALLAHKLRHCSELALSLL
jgi:hypothetical protein